MWSESDRRSGSRPGWAGRLAAALVLVVTASCGSLDDSGSPEAPTPPAAVPGVPVPEVSVPSAEVPAGAVPEVSVPGVSMASTTPVPSVTVSTASVRELESSEGGTTSAQAVDATPSTTGPTDADDPSIATVPQASDPATPDGAEASSSISVPTTPTPDESVPAATAPPADVPPTNITDSDTEAESSDLAATIREVETSVPTTLVPPTPVLESRSPTSAQRLAVESEASAEPSLSNLSLSLAVAPEAGDDYDRSEWGPHYSDLCFSTSEMLDPYTEAPIDVCHVDHVVALYEAHQSGGWAWSTDMKEQFSQDPANHVASRACVNSSKSGHDLFEWSRGSPESWSACRGQYAVTAAGRCFLALTTVTVKSSWGLTVDQPEADALVALSSACDDRLLPDTVTPEHTTVPEDEPPSPIESDSEPQ